MTIDELIAALEAAEARVKRLREALNHYMEKHCEAYSDCGAADITDGDCHGCVAKRALAETAP